MIPLNPNHTYRIRYTNGTLYTEGDAIYFRTLDQVPEAKHLIKVKNLETGEIVNLVELLAHPWDSLEEFFGKVPSPKPKKSKNGNSLKAFVPFIFSIRERTGSVAFS